MREIQSSLDDQSSDIHLMTDQAILKVESVQKAVNEQFHELTESVGQSLTRINEVVSEIDRSAERVDDVSDRIVGRLNATGEVAREECERLNIAATKSVQLAEVLVAQVSAESDKLLQVSRESLMDLRRTSDSFGQRAREVAEQMKASLHTAQSYSTELRTQAEKVADSSTEAADRISKATGELRGQMGGLAQVAGDGVGKIERARDILGGEAEKLLVVTNAASRAAEETANVFSRQSSALFKAIQDAARHIDDIRKGEARTQRDAFLSSAKFIVESLHSLSVDITRVLDGEVPERTWKAFQKGDVGAFTRRLSQLGRGAGLPMEKLRDKYANDHEFRSYVNRFLRQFEDIFEQAVANDHGDLLASTFVSSDVGQLYETLCSAAGREAKFNREERRAV